MDLRTWRKAVGRSQEEVALDLMVDQAYLSKLELGSRRASPELAARVAKMTKGKVKMVTREDKS